MIFWYTGQPGHGKSLHAIDHALKFRDEGRLVYVCNVRDFNYDKARVLEMTPEQFKDWPNFLPDGAVALVDEAYEHGMMPKRGPGTKCPSHVEQLAKHRHRGIDFIFVSQSPARQIDDFVHDLIEQHVHVRRRFGTQFVHLREFDKFERNPDKAHPINLRRVRLPQRPRGLYISTVLDTSEKRVPWYYYALGALLVALPIWFFFVAGSVQSSLSGDATTAGAATNGAVATVGAAKLTTVATPALSVEEYVARQIPRIPSVPWSAPMFDKRQAQADPEVFCMSSGPGDDGLGKFRDGSTCQCLTEQGTSYAIGVSECEAIARRGAPYNPFKAPERDQGSSQRAPGAGQRPAAMAAPAAAPSPVGIGQARDLQAPYGQFRSVPESVL